MKIDNIKKLIKPEHKLKTYKMALWRAEVV